MNPYHKRHQPLTPDSKALGIDIPKRPVLYLALEDGHRRLQDRCRRLLAGEKIPPEFHT
jgi:hypothetical protein